MQFSLDVVIYASFLNLYIDDMMSISRLIRNNVWSEADGGGCKTPARCV